MQFKMIPNIIQIPKSSIPIDLRVKQKRNALPFGDGPRNCIGLRFGMMQARIGLVTLLNHFDISVVKNTKIPFRFNARSFVTTPDGGMHLKLKRVK